MQPLGIVMLLTNRWHEADPPRESEAWWLRRGRRLAAVTPIRRGTGGRDEDTWIGSERWVG
jgi:hypothetical protein